MSFPFVRISEDDDESLPRAAALTIIIYYKLAGGEEFNNPKVTFFISLFRRMPYLL